MKLKICGRLEYVQEETPSKEKIQLKIDSNRNDKVKVTYNGSDFNIYMDRTLIITASIQGAGIGIVGFRVKGTKGSFDRIVVQ